MTDFINQIEDKINQPHLIFNDWQTIIRIILSGIIIYLLLILIFNFYGKRSLSNFSMHDYVVTIAMGSMVGSTIISKDASLMDGVVGILVLLSLQFLVTFLARKNPGFFRLLNSKPSVLFLEGDFITKNLIANRMTQEEVYSAIREKGQTTSDQIYAVIIESNGNLSVIKSASEDYKKEITRFL